ncbi:hypothetical protein CBR_g26390 [Chara braunii]|uniref:Oleosin n=1 Tax=Chara braunii TaxID=69332 RepID=A0A388L7R1_CHABU|nr:hypothetical protein CBR_g26390 [Chara braunii]|eukprot:GBG78361.1 hypothetical protein CBR_g26390 [Chara braunii]
MAEVVEQAQHAAAMAASRVQETAAQAVALVHNHGPQPVRRAIERVQGLSWKQWAIIVPLIGMAATALTVVVLLAAPPVLIVGGGLFLFFLPVILLTAPLWIPVAVVFLIFTGISLAAAVAVLYLFKYHRGSLPAGGEGLSRAQEVFQDAVQRSRDFLSQKAQDLTGQSYSAAAA